MSPVWDLTQLAGELLDWYNRIPQHRAKERCQRFLAGNARARGTLSPAGFVRNKDP